MSNNYVPILVAYSLAASTTYDVDFWMEDIKTARLLLEVTAPTTGTTQGVTVNLLGGVGTLQSNTLTGGIPVVLGGCASSVTFGPRFGDNTSNADPAATLTSFTASSGTPQTKRLYYYLDTPGMKWGDFCRHRFYNRDGVAYTISLYASIS